MFGQETKHAGISKKSCIAMANREMRSSLSHRFSTLQAESPSIFLEKLGRGRRLCERLRDSLIRCSSEKMDESVQFPVGSNQFFFDAHGHSQELLTISVPTLRKRREIRSPNISSLTQPQTRSPQTKSPPK